MADSFAAPLFETSGPNQFKTSLQGVATAATAIGTAFQGVSKSITASIAAMGTQLDQLTSKMSKIGGNAAGGAAGLTPGTTVGWGAPASAASALGSSGVGGSPGNVRGNGGRTSFTGGLFRSMSSGGNSGFSGGGSSGMGGGVPNGGSSFSGGRLAVGLGVAAAGMAGRYAQNSASVGTTWRQLEFNVQSATGMSQSSAGRYAQGFTGWGGDPNSLNTAIQTLQGSGGYGIGSKGFNSMMNSAGSAAAISQAIGGGLNIADTASTQQWLMSSAGRSALGRMGFSNLSPQNTNQFSVADLVSQRLGNGTMLSGKALASNSAPGTGLYNTLAQMGFNSQTIQTQISYLQRQQSTKTASGGVYALGASGETNSQTAAALKALGFSGTDAVKQMATAEQKARISAPMQTGAADSSTAMSQAVTNFTAGVAQFVDATGALRTALGGGLGATSGAGGLLGGGGILGQAGGSLLGNVLANRMGGKLGGVLGKGGSTGAASAAAADTGEWGAAATMGGVGGLGAVAGAAGPIAGAASVGLIARSLAAKYLDNPINSAVQRSGAPGILKGIVSGAKDFSLGGGVSGLVSQGFNDLFGRNSRSGQAGNSGAAAGTGSPTSAPSMAGNSSSMLADAEKYLGVPYRWGGTNPATGLDCSGLVQLAGKEAGIALPRTSQEQNRVGTAIPNLSAARAGDLVFYPGSDGTAQNPGHVGIYAGGGKMIDAPHTGTNVRFDNVGNPTSIRRIGGGVGSSGASNNNGGVGGGAYVGNTPAAGLGTIGLGEGTSLSESAILGAAGVPTFHSSPSGIPSAGNGGVQSNAAVSVGAVGSINNTSDFAKALLGSLGDPTTPANIASLVAWENREGGNWHNTAKYNPLNTTQAEPGYSKTGRQGNIGSYTSWAQGVLATAQTLTNGRYNDIDAALKQGIGLGTKSYASLGVWSGGGYTSLDSGTQNVGASGLYQLHANEMVIRPGAAAAMRMNQMSGGGGGPSFIVNFEKGSIVYTASGSSAKGSTPQQDGKSMADALIAEIEQRASLLKVAQS